MGARGKQPKVDPKQVESLAKLGCTYDEISITLGIDKSNLQRTPEYREAIRRGQAQVKMSLRRKQLQAALEDGNITMLIWLGKVMLDQREITKIEHELTVDYDKAAQELEDAILAALPTPSDNNPTLQ